MTLVTKIRMWAWCRWYRIETREHDHDQQQKYMRIIYFIKIMTGVIELRCSCCRKNLHRIVVLSIAIDLTWSNKSGIIGSIAAREESRD